MIIGEEAAGIALKELELQELHLPDTVFITGIFSPKRITD
jgi:hypothetical protein